MKSQNGTAKAELREMSGDTHSTFLPALIDSAPRPNAAQRRNPLALSNGDYSAVQYENEKRNGVRRKNGARKLKKLNRRHYEIISRHLQGESGEQISVQMNLTVSTISRILNDPLVKHFIAKIYEDRQAEIDALAGNAIDVVREGLRGDHPLREKLMAVDKFTKLKDSIGKKEDENLTAEDVIERMFSQLNVNTMNVQINSGDK